VQSARLSVAGSTLVWLYWNDWGGIAPTRSRQDLRVTWVRTVPFGNVNVDRTVLLLLEPGSCSYSTASGPSPLKGRPEVLRPWCPHSQVLSTR